MALFVPHALSESIESFEMALFVPHAISESGLHKELKTATIYAPCSARAFGPRLNHNSAKRPEAGAAPEGWEARGGERVAALVREVVTKHFLVAGMVVSILLAAADPTVGDAVWWRGQQAVCPHP